MTLYLGHRYMLIGVLIISLRETPGYWVPALCLVGGDDSQGMSTWRLCNVICNVIYHYMYLLTYNTDP